MGTAQIVMIVLLAMEGTMYLVKHGEMKSNPYYSFGEWIFNTVALVTLLFWGGFFK